MRGTISELCVIGKPVILVPSPNVAEDHQTHNARALSKVNAAVLLPETELEKLAEKTAEVLSSVEVQTRLSVNIKKLAQPNATEEIVNHIISLLK